MFNWKKPTLTKAAAPYGLYASLDSEFEKWTRIGDAWPIDDQHGFVFQLSLVPMSGYFVMRLEQDT